MNKDKNANNVISNSLWRNTAYATIIRSALNEISVNSVKFP